MIFLQILLIPFKILLKMLGYTFAAVLKTIGFIILAFSHVCGFVTNIFGGIILLAAIFYTVCGVCNFSGIQQIDMWWVSSITSAVFGLIVSSLSMWVELLGEQIHFWGDCLSDNVSLMGILPC